MNCYLLRLTSLSEVQGHTASNGKIIMNDKLERMWVGSGRGLYLQLFSYIYLEEMSKPRTTEARKFGFRAENPVGTSRIRCKSVKVCIKKVGKKVKLSVLN
jgi:hypothetical protein